MGCGASKAPVPAETTSTYAPPEPKPTAPAPAADYKSEPEPVVWVAPAGAVYHRLTKIPIKPGTMASIKAVAEGDAMKETMAGFVGFLGVESLSVDDSTMMTHSRWVSEEACTGGAAALGSVLKGHLSEFIAGPPDAPWVGPNAVNLDVGAGTPGAYRVVIMELKTGAFGTVAEYVPSKLADFQKIDGLINVTVFSAGATSGVVCAAYTSMAALEAATPIIGPLLAGMGPHFAKPPTPFGTVVEFSTLTTATAAAPASTEAAGAYAGTEAAPAATEDTPAPTEDAPAPTEEVYAAPAPAATEEEPAATEDEYAAPAAAPAATEEAPTATADEYAAPAAAPVTE